MNITQFFADSLHAQLINPVWSWGAIDPQNRIFLRVWQDQIHPDAAGEKVEVYWKNPRRHSAGYNERARHIELIRRGAQAFAVVCTARETPEGGREIIGFDNSFLLRLGALFEDDRRVYAYITSRIPISELTLQSTLTEDLTEIVSKENLDPTTKEALIDARVGQGAFRSAVLKLWNHRCSVTGSTTLLAIRASHIKPWRESTNEERLDPTNGIPLVASLDALFDAGLISFENSGRMLASSELSPSEQQIYNLVGKTLTKRPPSETGRYLQYHRTAVFRK